MINASGFTPTEARLVEPSYTYTTINGYAVLPTIFGSQHLEVEPASLMNVTAAAGNEIFWFWVRGSA